MSLNIGVNLGGVIEVTPGSSVALDVVIDGETYSEAWDTDVATTIDNWMSSFAEAVSVNHKIYAEDGTTTLDLNNVDAVRTITSTNAGVGARAEMANAGDFTLIADIATVAISGSTVVVTRSTVAGTNFVTATFTFASASEAKRGYKEIVRFQKNGERATANGLMINVPFKVAYS